MLALPLIAVLALRATPFEVGALAACETAAGLVIQWLTAPVSVAVAAVSFLGSALFVGLIRRREPKPERAPDAHLGREIREGLRFVLGNRLLRSIAMCTGTSNFFSAIFF